MKYVLPGLLIIGVLALIFFTIKRKSTVSTTVVHPKKSNVYDLLGALGSAALPALLTQGSTGSGRGVSV